MAKELHCGDIIDGCSEVIRGENEDEVLRKGAQHARDAHGIEHLDEEKVSEVRSKIRET